MKKKKRIPRRVIVSIVLSFVSILLVVLLLLPVPKATREYRVEQYYKKYISTSKPFSKSIIDDLTEIVDNVGIDGAFELANIGMDAGKLNRNKCHAIMHLLGHQAYSRNLPDIPRLVKAYGHTCQSGFPHGIEAQITLQETDIKERNLKLKDFCKLYSDSFKTVSCYHGVGHAYYQVVHDPVKALAACDTLGGKDVDLNPCYEGVFTEIAYDVLGVDGETDLPVPGIHKKIDDPEHPLLYCRQFDEKYQDSCFFIFPILLSNHRKFRNDFSPCLYTGYSEAMQAYCVKYMAAVTARDALDFNNSYIVPDTVGGMLSLPLQQAYVRGVLGAVNGYTRDRQEKDWKKICSTMPKESQAYCTKYFEENRDRSLDPKYLQ